MLTIIVPTSHKISNVNVRKKRREAERKNCWHWIFIMNYIFCCCLYFVRVIRVFICASFCAPSSQSRFLILFLIISLSLSFYTYIHIHKYANRPVK
ncbi:hypothetical protein DAPPUDRAFT_301038 [Daphnia pulex]|uniref:Uncharacterized protein n=1 Tax=Daphnia pulex TaxID=6669 RepID=E9HGH9_DAPPU|nr:hypothetical protein DAPPUDRAFT_301038 [Daphnia pulex]|eukprot:EFX69158.1 hypothetical protein DAPPUDRAFT_301038 [Daphnia pulex]